MLQFTQPKNQDVSEQPLNFLFHTYEGQANEKTYLLSPEKLLKLTSTEKNSYYGIVDKKLCALFLVSLGYQNGYFGFPLDPEKARVGFERLLSDESKKNTDEKSIHNCVIGYCAEFGLVDVQQDSDRASANYLRAINAGFVPALFLSIANGCSVLKGAELKQALMDCVNQEFVPAIGFLGMRYLDGQWKKLFKKQTEKGLNLLEIAALQGDMPSQVILCETYKQGKHGVAIDLQKFERFQQLLDKQQAFTIDSEVIDRKKCSLM